MKPTTSLLFAPPSTLSKDAATLWRRLVETHAIDDPGGRLLLQGLCESWDRVQQARKVIDKQGVVVTDRFGRPKVHPACAVERDARASMLHALKALNLDIEPTNAATGRPPNKR